jgi:hypothetical protein
LQVENQNRFFCFFRALSFSQGPESLCLELLPQTRLTRTPKNNNTALEAVDSKKKRIYFSGIDLIEGTPVLDIKPLHPAELPSKSAAKFPAWIQKAQNALTVSMTNDAEKQLTQCVEVPGVLHHYGSREDVRKAIIASLSLDPRTLHSKKKHSHGLFAIQLDGLDVAFQVSSANSVEVVKISISDSSVERRSRDKAGEQDEQKAPAAASDRPEEGHRKTGLRTKAWLTNLTAELKASRCDGESSAQGKC